MKFKNGEVWELENFHKVFIVFINTIIIEGSEPVDDRIKSQYILLSLSGHMVPGLTAPLSHGKEDGTHIFFKDEVEKTLEGGKRLSERVDFVPIGVEVWFDEGKRKEWDKPEDSPAEATKEQGHPA